MGKLCGVFKGPGDAGDVAKGHHRVAHRLERQRIDVLRVLDQAGNLDIERALAGIQRAAGHHHIVARQRVEQLCRGQVIGVQTVQIDGDLEHFVA